MARTVTKSWCWWSKNLGNSEFWLRGLVLSWIQKFRTSNGPNSLPNPNLNLNRTIQKSQTSNFLTEFGPTLVQIPNHLKGYMLPLRSKIKKGKTSSKFQLSQWEIDLIYHHHFIMSKLHSFFKKSQNKFALRAGIEKRFPEGKEQKSIMSWSGSARRHKLNAG